MLSSVLRSEQAVQVNIQIMRVYLKMKELLIMHKDILVKLEQLEKKTDKHNNQIQLIFSYIKKLVEQPKERSERIGFKKEWGLNIQTVQVSDTTMLRSELKLVNKKVKS